MVRWQIVFCFFIVLLTGSAAPAQFGGVGTPRFNVRAEVDQTVVIRGQKARIGVEVSIAPRYHLQTATPSDPLIVPTEIAISGVPGVTAGDIRCPVAQEIVAPEGTSSTGKLSVYSGKVYFVVPISIADNAYLGKQTLSVAVTGQACDDKSCLEPRTVTVPVDLMIAVAGTSTDAQHRDFFSFVDKQAYAETPATKPVAVATEPSPQVAPSPPGVKLMSEAEQLKVIAERKYRPANEEPPYPLYVVVLLALAGGAILNVMPCVLPVIPLKVLSLVQQAHGDRRLAIVHGLVFSAGVVTLFVVLAIVLRTFGWFYGQQFQSVGFLIALVMFVVALALSMLGVWTINPPKALYNVEAKISQATSGGGVVDYAGPATPQAGHGGASAYLGSFANGLMATLLATPCSAPFLGGVLAWALVQTTLVAALTLGLVGVGMSLPYLVLAMFPGLLVKVPRAGRWSELLKQGLGIVMIGVAVYLITLIPNATYWQWVLLGTVVVALVCWAWGQIPTYEMSAAKVWGIRAGAVIVGAALGVALWLLAAREGAGESPMAIEENGWQPFNVALLDEGLKAGRPVVVDWGARWCINCRALESIVLGSERVQKAFRDQKAVLLRADLTRSNPPASLFNRELGGEAIPVLAIFSPSRPTRPVVLRDSYTKERVVRELAGAR